MDGYGIDQPVGSDFLRIFVEVFDAKKGSGSYDERCPAQVCPGHGFERFIERRDDAGHANTLQDGSVQIFCGEKIKKMNAELVGGVMAVRVQTPSMLKDLVAEKADGYMRVADID